MPRPDPQTAGSGAEANTSKGNPTTAIHPRGLPRPLKVLRACQDLLLLERGRGPTLRGPWSFRVRELATAAPSRRRLI